MTNPLVTEKILEFILLLVIIMAAISLAEKIAKFTRKTAKRLNPVTDFEKINKLWTI